MTSEATIERVARALYGSHDTPHVYGGQTPWDELRESRRAYFRNLARIAAAIVAADIGAALIAAIPPETTP